MMISFGGMSRPLKEQFLEYGKSFDDKDIERLQKMADAVTYLKIHSILTETETRNARRRIIKEINRLG